MTNRVANKIKAAAKASAPLSRVRFAQGAIGHSALVSHNLNGQRLGRKGRDTRERIIATALEILSEPSENLITLSEVARRAKLRMGTLYLYFADLTELVLAALEPVMSTAEEEFIGLLRTRWADEELGNRATEFVTAYLGFWIKHSRLLHLRNSMSDRFDERLMIHRVRSAQPIMRLFVAQMDGDPEVRGTPRASMATVLMTGLERVATATTDTILVHVVQGPENPRTLLINAQARLIELGIRDYRRLAKS